MIELKDISKIYKIGKITVPALKNISFQIEDGEFVAIMGPSGSGKSTLLNILGCLDPPTDGEYILDGINTKDLSDSDFAQTRNERIGFVFQSFNLLPRLSAVSNVELPLIYAGDQRKRREKALAALQVVGLENRKTHRPKELSGGEQQRVAIARAFINNPTMILADEPTGNLDSKSGTEIMNILSELNEKGITVIVVTHEGYTASYAKRTIKLKDGGVIEDKKACEKACINKQPEPLSKKKRKGFSFNELKENMSMALSSINANKLRSFMTMLGIVVGVAAVIAMIALGQGASADITERISQMGANLLMVRSGSSFMGPPQAAGSITPLTYDEALAIGAECPSVAKVDASFSRNTQVVYGNRNTNTEVNGVTPNFPEVRNFSVATGSFFTDEDNKLVRKVAVVGKTVVKDLFETVDPIGQYIKIKRINFLVIGIMNEKGSSGWHDEDNVIFIPLLTAQKRLFGVDRVSLINVMAKNEDVMDEASVEITALLKQRHRIRAGEENDFSIRSQTEILSTVQETSRTFTLLLAGIAVVSLIVGGIGIMNIMFVSVTERTQEIGIRKAIGAQRRDILGQFLIEAVIVSLSGGTIGVFLGILASKIMSQFFGWQTVVTSGSVLLSFFFAFAVGLFFGLYPARKAAIMNPIEALRHE